MSRVVIDVREPAEYAQGHVEKAINIPIRKLAAAQEFAGIPKDAEVITYCRSGNRSGRAADMLKSMGYQNVTNGINQQHIESE